MTGQFDVIVVGAGPAGSLAALKLARAGLGVALVERGQYPGAKNMFGGLLHNTISLGEAIPSFQDKAPLERRVFRKTLAFMTPTASVSMTYETQDFGVDPANGYTVFRPVFDRWLAGEAVREGAVLFCDCTAADLIHEDGKVAGITIKGREGELKGKIVIAADGVLSFLSRKAGLGRTLRPENFGLGIKLLLRLPKVTIDERFHLVRDEGADFSFVGITEGMPGGGFIYTNYDTISVGLVLHLDALKASGQTPYGILATLQRHPDVHKLVKGAVPLEYSAHLIPEGGLRAMPKIYADGIMVAGDAAGLCYTNGINLEGINLAMTSGALAAETAIEAVKANDYSARMLAGYHERLKDSFVLKDMKTFSRAVDMMRNRRLYRDYPEVICHILEKIYRVEGIPRSKILKLARQSAREKVKVKHLISDSINIGRSLL